MDWEDLPEGVLLIHYCSNTAVIEQCRFISVVTTVEPIQYQSQYTYIKHSYQQ